MDIIKETIYEFGPITTIKGSEYLTRKLKQSLAKELDLFGEAWDLKTPVKEIKRRLALSEDSNGI